MATIRISKRTVEAAPAPERGDAYFWDDSKEGPSGFGLRVTARGVRSYVFQYRLKGRPARRITIGRHGNLTADEARGIAKKHARNVADGIDPAEQVRSLARDTFKAVSEDFLDRHVDKNKLRSAKETRRLFETYVWPELGERPFLEVRRRAVTDLLDKIEDGKAGEDGDLGGPVQADRVLAALSKMFAWRASRDDDYLSPIVRGMRRTKPRERARDRVIGQTAAGEPDDGELRLFWRVAGEAGAYGAFLKLCLLTAQRRAKVVAMRWSAISDKGAWTIPADEREKANAGIIDLPKLATDIIAAQPKVKGNPHVFAGRGKAPLYPGHKLKLEFDADLAKANGGKAIPHWTVHDLRRTAKTLMRRAGVDSEVSERVLGHAIPGVEGVYDRHGYRAEKKDALKRLAGLIELILAPRKNVVRMERRK